MKTITHILKLGGALAVVCLLCGCLENKALRIQNSSLKELCDDLEENNKKYKTNFYDLLKQKDDQKVKFEKQISQLELEKNNLQGRRGELEKELQRRNEELTLELDTQVKENEETKLSANAKIQEADKKLADKEKTVAGLNEQIISTKAEHDATKTELTKAQAELTSALAQLGQLDTAKAELQKQLADNDKEIKRRDTMIAELAVEARQATDTTRDVQKTLAEKDAKIKALSEELKTATSAKALADAKVADNGKKILELTKLLADKKNGLTTEQVKTYLDDIKRLQAEIAELEKNRGKNRAELDPELTKALEQLKKALQPQVDQKALTVLRDDRGVFVSISAEQLFKPGTTEINPGVVSTLKTLAQELAKLAAHPVMVEGHTDDQIVIEMPFPDNLALSAMRAVNAARKLRELGDLKQPISAIGCGDSKPLASNKNLDGRKLNRRVEIIIGPAPVKK